MIAAFWGENKTGKTTLGLTFPKLVMHFDLDYGFERASHRFNGEVKAGQIKSKPYPIPIQFGVKVEGVRQVWQEFQKDYLAALKSKEVATTVIDTSTQLWEICRLAYLQEKQEAQSKGERLRERLLPIEYGEPNARMRSIIYAARSHGKNLVMTHYARDEYITRLNQTGAPEDVRSGKLELDGFKYTEGLVDLVTHTYTRPSDDKNPNSPPIPYCVITISGLHLGMVGQQLKEPSYDSIMNMLEMLRGEE